MDAADLAAVHADLAAKSSRIADLEARVSLLEAENERLREAMGKGEPVVRAGRKGLVFRRLGEILGGGERNAAEKAGARAAHDVVEISDGEEEEGVAVVDVDTGRSAEEGVLAVPTPRKCAERVLTGESEDEEEIEGAGRSGHCGGNVGLEDDDVSTTPHRKKRTAARVIASDSEDEDARDDQDAGLQEETSITPSRIRKGTLCGVSDSENEQEDDKIPICEVIKKMRQERFREDDGLGETKGCSTPTTRRSARLVKSHTKRVQTARRKINFVEPKDYEVSEDDLDEDDDMGDFIEDDEDCSENTVDSAEESSAEPEDSGSSAPTEESYPGPEESDSEINYKDVMDRIARKRNASDWKFEAHMLSAFAEHPELCLKAVCALYRKQTSDERSGKFTLEYNRQGFNMADAFRGSRIAEFLLDGETFGPLKKTVHDLEKYDRKGLDVCHKLAARYSKQLFAIYQNKEDPYFP